MLLLSQLLRFENFLLLMYKALVYKTDAALQKRFSRLVFERNQHF